MNLTSFSIARLRFVWSGLGSSILLCTFVVQAGIAPERVLPVETVGFCSIPSGRNFIESWNRSGPGRLVSDAAMQRFIQNLEAKWTESVKVPFDRTVGLSLNFSRLLRGQSVLGVIRDADAHGARIAPGFVLLLDAQGDNDAQNELRLFHQKGCLSVPNVRTNLIAGVPFLLLPVQRETFSSVLIDFGFSCPSAGGPLNLFIGVTNSVLIAGSSSNMLSGIVTRLAGNAKGGLAERPDYKNNPTVNPQGCSWYGWVSAQPLFNAVSNQPALNKDGPGSALGLAPESLSVLGLSAVETISFGIKESGRGHILEILLGLPATNRTGLAKLLGAEAKSLEIPGFVPADATSFYRWRFADSKPWTQIESLIRNSSPQMGRAVSFLLDSANAYAQQGNPEFDIRTNLLGNVGDDFILYQKKRLDSSTTQSALLSIGSPNAAELAASLQSLLIFFSKSASTPPEIKDYSGHKVYSLPLHVSLPGLAAGLVGTNGPVLHYASTPGYVALTMNSELLEEHLRLCTAQPKPLQAIPEIATALQRVSGAGSSFACYQDHHDGLRRLFEHAHQPNHSETVPSGASSSAQSSTPARKWFAPDLLPSFDNVKGLFTYSASAISANPHSIGLRLFIPASGDGKP